MSDRAIPVVVRVSIPQVVFNPGAIDTEVYCCNNTDRPFSIRVRNETFTTIDESSGDSVAHGSAEGDYFLTSRSVQKIADVQGWEWDGHVGLEISFVDDSGATIVKQYDLKRSTQEIVIASLGLTGRIIEPL